MCVQTALRLHNGNDRDELFLCLLRIKFWVLILFLNLLDKATIVSYNTTPAEKEWCVVLCSDHMVWPCDLTCAWPHSYRRFLSGRPHAVIGVFLICSLYFSSLPADEFLEHFYTSKWWPHIIFLDTDLTTFLTIVTSGVHGDKMSREYEKAVFA